MVYFIDILLCSYSVRFKINEHKESHTNIYSLRLKSRSPLQSNKHYQNYLEGQNVRLLTFNFAPAADYSW